MSHDHTVAEHAAKLVRENILAILFNIKTMIFLDSMIQKLESGLGTYRGLVLVSGTSAKAARYREITGTNFAHDGVDCRPILAKSEEDFQKQWHEWTGASYRPGDDFGPFTVIAFAGTGHAIFKIDPTEQDPDLVTQAEEMFLKNVTDNIMDIITMASDERFQHARIRREILQGSRQPAKTNPST